MGSVGSVGSGVSVSISCVAGSANSESVVVRGGVLSSGWVSLGVSSFGITGATFSSGLGSGC